MMQTILKYGASPFKDKNKDYREYRPNQIILLELKRFRIVEQALIQIRSFLVFLPDKVKKVCLRRRATQLPDYLLNSTEELVPNLNQIFGAYLKTPSN